MNRHLIGILAVALLLGALAVFCWNPSEMFWLGAFLRMGLVMAAVWLAYPQVSVLPKWLIGGLLVLVLAALLMKPRYLVLALALMAVIAMLRPRLSRPRL